MQILYVWRVYSKDLYSEENHYGNPFIMEPEILREEVEMALNELKLNDKQIA